MVKKVCTKCNQEKDLDLFVRKSSVKSGYASDCLSCRRISRKIYVSNNLIKVRESNKEYGRLNKEKQAERQAERRFKLRAVVLKKMGAECKNCSYNDFRALQIDHIKSNGKIDRIDNKNYNEKFLKYLINLDNIELTDNYQLLCANCNSIKKLELGEYGNRQGRWKADYFKD